jgi:predicted permease
MYIDRQDLLYAIRSARRAPLLSLIAIVALSLGIGLNAGVFTLLNAIFLAPPTDKDLASFVEIYPRYEGWFTGAGQYSSFTTDDYDAIRTRSTILDEVTAWQPTAAIFEHGYANRGIPVFLIACNFFHVFGTDRPQQGRLFAPQECSRSANPDVVILSDLFWKSRLGADPHILGKSIHLNGIPFTVVGIVPSDSLGVGGAGAGVYLPYTSDPLLNRSTSSPLASSDTPWLSIAGRLRAGHSRADAQSELTTILRQQDRAYLERKVTAFNRKTSVILTNGSFIETPAFHDQVLALLGLILGPLSLVLLLACSNVTMLFLSRSVVRRGEIAVRLALGVGRARLLRMLLLESFLTTSVAALASVVLAQRVPQLIINAANPNLAVIGPLVHPDWRVFGYLATLVAIATVASSLAPMHAAWKLDLITALKGRESTATMRSRLTGGLIVAQIAMSFVLLTAAVMFAQMPGRVTAMDPGFETRQTLYVPLGYDNSPQNRAGALSFLHAVETRLRAIPGVQSLAYESAFPFRQVPPSEIRLPNEQKGQGKPASIDNVSSDFFSTFGIRLQSGRAFVASDPTLAGTSSVAVVSEAFAKIFWPGQDPLGKVVLTPDDKRCIVIGVASDTRSERFGVLDGPRLYTLRDPAALDGQLYLRFAGNTTAIETAVRDAVQGLDSTQVMSPQTVWEMLQSDADNIRSLSNIVVTMASIAVLLAVTGVYGVLSFAINQRTRELGVRMVLGANRAAIFRSILARGARQISIGLACGFVLTEPAAWAFVRLLKRSPFPFRTFDPAVYTIAAALLIAVSIAAMLLPARRAMQVDPIKALRTD